MTTDQAPGAENGQAAAPADDQAPGATGTGRAAIVLVERDPGERETLYREMDKRYGADYQIVVCGEPAEAEAQVAGLLAAGTPVALVIGGVGEADPAGLGVLASIRRIDPTASRVAAVRWGEWDTARPIFDAITTGTIDHWVTRPVQSADEDFHHSITQFLSEWNSERGGGNFEAVQVIGEQWSGRSQELRDTFSRNGIPVGFYNAETDEARRMLHELHPDSAELPAVVLRFGGQPVVLANPSNLEIAEAFGLMTPISADEVFDVAVVGAGPAGLADPVSIVEVTAEQR